MSGAIPLLPLFPCMDGYRKTFTYNDFSLLPNVSSTVALETQWKILMPVLFYILLYSIVYSISTDESSIDPLVYMTTLQRNLSISMSLDM
jgi:hypothetical protein